MKGIVNSIVNSFGGTPTEKFSPKFSRAIPLILKHEGGYVNHPDDPGGETKYGITKRTYPHLDIKTLTVDDAKRIYFEDFWKKYSYENFEFLVGEKVMDMAVNMGPSRSHKLLQQAVNELCLPPRLKVDGIIGPNTMTRTNSLNGSAVRDELRKQQKEYYLRLIEKRPSLAVFRKGWLRRARA